MEQDFEMIEGELCAFCNNKTLTLMETVRDIPFFGMCHIFSMDCSSCKYHKADVEADQQQDPVKYAVEISSEEDLHIRIIKSSSADVKVPYIGEILAGETSNGYITNVEGILNRLKQQVEHLKESADDPKDRKKAKNVLKKLQKVLWGQEKVKMILSDPQGNSAIISDKAKKEKLKV